VGEVLEGALGEIAGADFVTRKVWTWCGLVTFYTVFAIDLATPRPGARVDTPSDRSSSWAKWPGW
jgi:hypothetical protein